MCEGNDEQHLSACSLQDVIGPFWANVHGRTCLRTSEQEAVEREGGLEQRSRRSMSR